MSDGPTDGPDPSRPRRRGGPSSAANEVETVLDATPGAGRSAGSLTASSDGQASAREEHERVVADGAHLFSHLVMRDVEVDGADLAIELELSPRYANPQGGLQGGLVATLADIVAGRAANESLEPGLAAVTADLHVHYLLSIRTGPAVAVARIVRKGRRSIVVQVDIHDGHQGPLAAVCTLTWSVISAPT